MKGENKMTKEEEKQLIETVDEDGNVVNFELFDIIEFEGNEYALLLPVVKEEGMEEDEVVLMRLQQEGDEYIFEAIQNDDEFEKVSQYIESMDEDEE